MWKLPIAWKKQFMALAHSWLKILSVANYVVIYDPTTKPLRIIRLLHGAREMHRELKA